MQIRTFALLAMLAVSTSFASADQIVFKNGDKLTGTIEMLDGGKLKIKSAIAGEITVDLKDVATFSTDGPVDIRMADGQKLNSKLQAGEADQVKTAEGKVIAVSGITVINPPPQKWTGAVVANVAIARGNTNTDVYGLAIDAMLRRKDDLHNDRFSIDGAYNLGRQKDSVTGDKVSTTDNWFAAGKFDQFWDPKLYTYGVMKVEHDYIAALNYRLSPGVGVGYQWVESPVFNFNTEAGVSYVYEDYVHDGNDDHIALRLAYHVDKQLNDKVKAFHNLEWLPAIEDPSDYNLTTDVGIRADMTATMFAEFKVQWKRDSTPAPGALKNDLQYLLGLGWKF